MKIRIVTVYNSENCGSFLQAYALSKVLKNSGHEVTFLKRKANGTSHSLYHAFGYAIKMILKGKMLIAIGRIKSYYAYDKAVKASFKTIKCKKWSKEKVEVNLIGSDTLWDFDSPYFFKHKALYSGFLFRDQYTVTYAVSIANTLPETILSDSEIKTGIIALSHISAREKKTAELCERITQIRVPIVLDPTLLLNSSDYLELESFCKESKFILVYCFHEIPESIKQKMLALRKEYGYKILSYGIYRNWTDGYIPSNPHSFLGYFHQAEFVFTNTFHGTIFSIIYRKKFLSLGKEKSKIVDLLSRLDLDMHLCDETVDLNKYINKMPDYNAVFTKLKYLRMKSLEYLSDCGL